MFKHFISKIKSNKIIIIFILFSSIFFLASGEDVPWIGIIITSLLYGIVATTFVYLIYKFFSILVKGIQN